MLFAFLFVLFIVAWAIFDYYDTHNQPTHTPAPPFDPTSFLRHARTDSNDTSYLKANDEFLVSEFRSFKRSYLNSIQWQKIRSQIIQRDRTCRICQSSGPLEVHHLSYKNLGSEKPTELVALCRTCHQSRHDLLGIPQTLQEYQSFNDTLV